MRPQTLQTPRNVVTAVMTAIGIGLFIVVAVKAVHQIADRQYVVGKQRGVSGASQSSSPTSLLGSFHYANGSALSPQPRSSSVPTPSTSSPKAASSSVSDSKSKQTTPQFKEANREDTSTKNDAPSISNNEKPSRSKVTTE